MKITLKNILDSKEALSELAKARGMKSVVAYRIGKNVKEIDKELENYNDSRKKLIEDRANKNNDGEPVIITHEDGTSHYEISKENIKEIELELQELLKEEVEISIAKVTLEDIENAQLSAFQLNAIEYMLEVTE